MKLLVILIVACGSIYTFAQSSQTDTVQPAQPRAAHGPTSSTGSQKGTQPAKAKQPASTDSADGTKAQAGSSGAGTDANNATLATISKQVEDLSKSIQEQEQISDFALVLGTGSLIDSTGATDYTLDNNIISASNLGTATPQYLVGASFRVPVQWATPFAKGKTWDMCYPSTAGTVSKESAPTPAENCQVWRLHPWSGFLSLKFSASASQTLSGYVLGGTYQFARYLSGLVGFGLTPFNEASKGFRVFASQYVTAQQAMGNLLNFSPSGLLTGGKNAFDGFSLVDPSGKLIYTGKPLEVHYRGGVVVGVVVPLSFNSVLGQKNKQ